MTGNPHQTYPRLTARRAVSWPCEPGMEAYARMSLRDLAACIVEHADRSALEELHGRPAFNPGDDEPLTLTGYVDRLRRHAYTRRTLCADRAYDLTLDRFSRLPKPSAAVGEVDDPLGREETAGPDCRRYFGAFLRYVDGERVERLRELEREEFEARALRRLVHRHFRLAVIEAHRTGDRTRYVWRLPTGELTLLMPRHVAGRERGRWLEEHVPDADASRDGERERVQAVIDAAFRYHHVPHSRGQHDWFNPVLGRPPPIPGEDPIRISEAGLAETVAQEKTACIDEQRPAIRNLGPERLARMIRKIFDGLTEEGFELGRIAEEYGVSKPTMTRFAGTRWAAGDPPRAGAVPDLWRNTARVLGSDPDFVEAARQAGVWRRVEEALDGRRS